MSVKKQMPPKWAKDAVASPQGWRHPRTRELLVARGGLVVDVEEKVVEVKEPIKPTKPTKPTKTTKKTVKKD
jgi:hypothetical protein